MMGSKINGYQQAGAGLTAAGGATSAIPYVGAALSAAGLLSSLYGGYKAQQTDSQNYEDQMREFERQKMLDAEERRRLQAERDLKQQMDVSNFGDQNDQNRMAQYAKYYSAIGK